MPRLALVASCVMAIATAAGAQLPVPTAQDIDSFRQSDGILPALVAEEPLLSWDRALKRELAGGTAEAAADRLAGRYSLPVPAMRELVTLWLGSQTETAAGFARSSSVNGARLESELGTRFAALLATAGRRPLLLQAAAAGLRGGFGEDHCTAAGFDTLMHRSADPLGEGWLLARTANCPAWWRRFAELHPDHRTAALLPLAFDEDADRSDRLALLRYLTSEPAAVHVAAPDRAALLARLRAEYMAMLLQAGLVEVALRFDAGLNAADRRHMLERLPEFEVHVDGLALRLPETLSDGDDTDISSGGTAHPHAPPANEFLQAQLAAAYIVAGRADDARAQFMPLRHAGDVAAAMACGDYAEAAAPAGRLPPRCPNLGHESWRLVLLDHALNHGRNDPYLIAEALIGGPSVEETGVWAELVCQILDEPKYAEVCARLREATRHDGEMTRSADAPPDPFAAALDAVQPPELASARASMSSLVGAHPASSAPAAEDNEAQRAMQHPEPTPFVEAPIPVALRGPGSPQSWDGGWAPLPKGFEPVRIGRDGRRIAVVSVSQNYDPTGEVSRGGYWVHLSDDGGRSWGKPLYTGLAEFYPYMVLAQSALPLFHGDSLQLAVEVKELDPASITYPPIALRTRRQAEDLYLTIPLADLARDSDGDGFTDVAARHLLLDAPVQGTPMLIGTDPGSTCRGGQSNERQALATFLAALFGSPTGAVVEPVDRRPDAPFESTTRAPNSADRPVFIEGDPAELACLRTGRPTIIYRPADVARMRKMAPDFHAVKLGTVIYNRAHDRGVFSFSTGWSGGTVRLRRTAAGWQLEPLSQWAT